MTDASARTVPTLVVTTESIPTFDIVAVIGHVCGSTASPCDPYSTGVKLLTGRVNPDGSRELVRARSQAVEQMVVEAKRLGANAVIGMRFDNRVIGMRWTEICAYGTAVQVRSVATRSDRHPVEYTMARQSAAPATAVPSPRSSTRAIDWVAVDRNERRAVPQNRSAGRRGAGEPRQPTARPSPG